MATTRGLLYTLARLMGDVTAVKKGKIGQRVVRRGCRKGRRQVAAVTRGGAMRKVLAVAMVSVVFALVLFGTATAASGPTLRQFNRLQRQVNRLENRVEQLEAAPTDACLTTIPVSVFDDYLADDGFTSITGLDVDNAAGPDYRVVIRTC